MRRGTEAESAKRRNQAVEMHNNGMSYSQISKALDVSVYTVQYYMYWEKNHGKEDKQGNLYFKKPIVAEPVNEN
jgi:orotate phosphoribosyltransferase-like protein